MNVADDSWPHDHPDIIVTLDDSSWPHTTVVTCRDRTWRLGVPEDGGMTWPSTNPGALVGDAFLYLMVLGDPLSTEDERAAARAEFDRRWSKYEVTP